MPYFIYDATKLLVILFIMISVIGFIRTYIPKGQIFGNHWSASLFGAITPFCSCSSIPVFAGIVRSGAPVGIALSFLITSPLVNEYLVVLLITYFGWKITVAYVAAGILLGVGLGYFLGLFNIDRFIRADIQQKKCGCCKIWTLKTRLLEGIEDGWDMIKKLYLWVLAGVAVGALIHNYVPTTALQGLTGPLAVPGAVLIGMPMYASSVTVAPIAAELFAKGLPLGTVISFMMAVAALSLPEAVMLRRIMTTRLVVVFFVTVGLAITIVGYLFNLL